LGHGVHLTVKLLHQLAYHL